MHVNDMQPVNRKLTVAGIPVTVEVPRGQDRILHDAAGNVVYRRRMHYSYGYIDGTKGRDGDEVDVFVGPMLNAPEVFVVHMKDMGPVPSEREDEDKVFLGFSSAGAAKSAFLMHYPPDFYESMSAMPVERFKVKLKQASKPYRAKRITAASAIICKVCKRALDRKDRRAGFCQKCGRQVPVIKSGVTAGSVKVACPKCSSKNIVLMPTDFETAKCKECGKTFPHPDPPVPGRKTVKADYTDSFPIVPVAKVDNRRTAK